MIPFFPKKSVSKYFNSQFQNNNFFISNNLLKKKPRPKYSTFKFHIESSKNICEWGYFDSIWGYLKQNCGRVSFLTD